MIAVVVLLGVLLIGTNVAWMVFTHRLMNKLMSRNFGDYLQAQAAVTPKAPRVPPAEAPDEDLRTLAGFNPLG